MSQPSSWDRTALYKDQFSGIAVKTINDARLRDEVAKLAAQDLAFDQAIEQIDGIRTFLGSPEKILGNPLTKHGEIAEQVEVGVRNARALLHQKEIPATFEGVGRTAPTDYLIDGVAVQSKFINGDTNNLNAVLDHMEQYSNFGRDGSYYHIPRDTYDAISKIMEGENGEFSDRTADAIREKVQLIQERSGQAFDNVVKPGISEYAEVQQGRVFSTLERHQTELNGENARLKDQVVQDHQPSLINAAYAATLAASVGGALSLSIALYGKYQSGKNPFKGEFSADDWKDVGIDTAQGAGLGAVSGVSIYLMTNYASLSAPFAAAVVSAVKGTGSLISQLNAGEINFDQFVDLGLIVCSESAIVGLATVAGQTLIPVPLIGAVIGSLAGRMLAEFATGKTAAVAARIQREMQDFLKGLDEQLQQVLRTIDAAFERLGALTEAAFDLNRNLALLETSVQLAREYGVPSRKIIADQQALDAFMLS